MNREELISIGDASIRKALKNMYAILDRDGKMLSKAGGDRMLFSPRLECDGECSALVFDEPEKAVKVIDQVLLPQDDGMEYAIYQFSDGDGLDGSEDDFEYETFEEPDDGICPECGEEGCVCSCGDGESSGDDEDLDAEIAKAEKDGDEKLVSMLKELKELRCAHCTCDDDENPDDGEADSETGVVEIEDEDEDEDEDDEDDEDEDEDEDEDGSVKESLEKCPTMREAQKVFKRNGYELVSQRGSHQKWVKEGDRVPIILPYHSRDNEQVRPQDWKRIVKEHNLRLDV